MRLADFIHDNRASIVAEWDAFARSLLPAHRNVSASTLRDHAAEILDAIVDDMGSVQSRNAQTEKSRGRSGGLEGPGKVHAGMRIETGFRLDQVVAEYRALRASVLRLWELSPEPRDLDGVTRFNEAIDEVLAESTSHYVQTMEHHRDQFLGILGHDLRNPLGAILMGASVLTESSRLDDRSVRVAAVILSSARRMERLVADLLDLTHSRLGRGIPIVRRPVDLGPLCRQVVAEVKGAHPDATVHLTSAGDLRGEWDSDRLAQMVSNLVVNAVQHGKRNAPVGLCAQAVDDEIVVEVQNEGPPIPRAELGTIFEPMIRHQRDDDKATGLGLGLYIVDQVVKAHGGRVAVSSTELGTTFSVHLPRRPSPEQREADARQADQLSV